MKKYLLVMFVLMLTGLAGCDHTIQGFGQDMQHAGKKIQDSAEK